MFTHNNLITIFFFCGDVNALHSIWDNTNKIKARGNIIAISLINQSYVYILNNGKQTRLNLSGNTLNAIGISGASSKLANSILWMYYQLMTMLLLLVVDGSDWITGALVCKLLNAKHIQLLNVYYIFYITF